MKLLFDDFECYREAAMGWGLEFIQLDRGPFTGALRQIAAPRVSLTHFRFNRKFYQRGEIRAPGRTFAIFLNRISPMRWQNSPSVDSDTLVIFPPDGALDALTNPGFDAVSISIDQTFLRSVGEDHDLERSCDAVPDRAVNFQTDGRLIEELRRNVWALLDASDSSFEAISSFEIEFNIAILILKAVAVGLPPDRRASPRKRDRALAAALDYIVEAEGPPTLPDLCNMVGASERTLRYAFQERFGVSPKHFINAQRLQQVRKHILASPSGASPIQDIATQYGYWHTGQFAADYRAMFGELPSETLRRVTGHGPEHLHGLNASRRVTQEKSSSPFIS